MNVAALMIHREHCFLHILKRAKARKINLSPEAAASLQDAINRLEPAFVRAGTVRYRLRVRHASRWVIVTYDARLHCLVTVWPDPHRGHL